MKGNINKETMNFRKVFDVNSHQNRFSGFNNENSNVSSYFNGITGIPSSYFINKMSITPFTMGSLRYPFGPKLFNFHPLHPSNIPPTLSKKGNTKGKDKKKAKSKRKGTGIGDPYKNRLFAKDLKPDVQRIGVMSHKEYQKLQGMRLAQITPKDDDNEISFETALKKLDQGKREEQEQQQRKYEHDRKVERNRVKFKEWQKRFKERHLNHPRLEVIMENSQPLEIPEIILRIVNLTKNRIAVCSNHYIFVYKIPDDNRGLKLELKLYSRSFEVFCILTLKDAPDDLICGCVKGMILTEKNFYERNGPKPFGTHFDKTSNPFNVISLVECGKFRFVSSTKRSIIVWNYLTKQSEFRLDKRYESVCLLRFDSKEKKLTFGYLLDHGKRLVAYDCSIRKNTIFSFRVKDSKKNWVAGKKVPTRGEGRAQFDFQESRSFDIHCYSPIFDTYNKYFYIGMKSGTIHKCCIRTGFTHDAICNHTHTAVVQKIVITSNQNYMISFDRHKEIRVFRTKDDICIQKMKPYGQIMQSIIGKVSDNFLGPSFMLAFQGVTLFQNVSSLNLTTSGLLVFVAGSMKHSSIEDKVITRNKLKICSFNYNAFIKNTFNINEIRIKLFLKARKKIFINVLCEFL